MSTVVEIAECDDPSSMITVSLCRTLAQEAKLASRHLAVARGAAKNAWLKGSADALTARRDEILAANARDVQAAPAQGLNAAAIDRLMLNQKRIDEMTQTLKDVAALPDPVGETVASSRRPNGLDVRQVRVPLGVVFMIYESRPNVTVDAAALCVKSGNSVILRGGKEAIHTNRALHRVLADELSSAACPNRLSSLSRLSIGPRSASCCGSLSSLIWRSREGGKA